MTLVPAISSAATIPGEAVMTDPTALHEVAMGVAWWQQHGVTGCPAGVAPKTAPDKALKIYVAADATPEQLREWGPDFDIEGLANVLAPHRGGCTLWIARSVYDIYATQRSFYWLNRTCRPTTSPGARRYYCDDRLTVEGMRDWQAQRCVTIRHELGHAIGGLADDEVSPNSDITDTMAQGALSPTYADCDDLARVTWRYMRPKPRARAARHRRHGHFLARREPLR